VFFFEFILGVLFEEGVTQNILVKNISMSASNRRHSQIEFTVCPTEKLYLEGKNNVIERVNKDVTYPCQMQVSIEFYACCYFAKFNLFRNELFFLASHLHG